MHYDVIASDSDPFEGYRAAAIVLEALLRSVTSDDNFRHISADTHDLLFKLRAATPIDKLIYYHSVFLSDSARAAISVRIKTFLFHDLCFIELDYKWRRRDCLYWYLPEEYTSWIEGHYPTDDLHPRFEEVRLHAKEFIEVKNQMKSRGQQGPDNQDQPELSQVQPEKDQPPKEQLICGEMETCVQQGPDQPELPPQVHPEGAQSQQEEHIVISCNHKRFTGKLLVIINRNCVMHPKGSQSDAVKLLHVHMPLYLPAVQYLLMFYGMWPYFKIEEFFPEETLGFR